MQTAYPERAMTTPSSPSASPGYFYDQQGQKVGPIALDELRSLVQAGQLNSDSLLLRENGQEWKPAKAIAPSLFPEEIAREKEANAPVTPSSMRPASFWSKFLALALDTLIIGVAGLLVFVVGLGLELISFGLLTPVVIVVSVVILIGYFPFFFHTRMQTLGMQALKLKIRTVGGGRVPIGPAIGRTLATVLSGLPLCLGYFWSLGSPWKQTWHDSLAGTVIVEEQ